MSSVVAQAERHDVVEHAGCAGAQIDDAGLVAIRASRARATGRAAAAPTASAASSRAAVRPDRISEPPAVVGKLRVGGRSGAVFIVAVERTITKLGASAAAPEVVRNPLPV